MRGYRISCMPEALAHTHKYTYTHTHIKPATDFTWSYSMRSHFSWSRTVSVCAIRGHPGHSVEKESWSVVCVEEMFSATMHTCSCSKVSQLVYKHKNIMSMLNVRVAPQKSMCRYVASAAPLQKVRRIKYMLHVLQAPCA